MKPRNTLILLVLAACLFLFIRFYESKLPGTKEAAEREARVLHVDRDTIDGISITNNEDKVELRKRDNEWFLDAPVKDRADSTAIATLLTSVETLRKEAVIGPDGGKKPDLKEYGLAKSSLRLKLTGSGETSELLFGKDAAVEGKVYARLENSETAFLIGDELKTQLTKKADEFRDRRLSNLTAAQIKRVNLKTASGEIELENSGDHWQLNKPLTARADDSKVSDLVAQALTTRIDTFVAGDDALATAGLSEPRGTLSFFAEGRDKPTVLQIGQPSEKEKEKIYAKLSTREGTYLLPKKIEDFLNLKPDDLRDRRLVRVNFDMVDRLTIEPTGKPKIVLARQEEDWTIQSAKGRRANSAEIKRFITELQAVEAGAFVSNVESEVSKYGLDRPVLKIALSAYASENTAESKAGESPIVTILFGRTEDDKVFAKLDNEPFVVSIPQAFVERVFSDPAQWQDVSIFKLKPDDIVSLDLTKGNQPSVSLTRSGREWKAAKPEVRVNETNVQSLLNTLCSLRAARWAGLADRAGGDKPGLTITFTSADKTVRKVTVGSPTPDGMWLSTAEGVEGTFVLPRPDVEALGLPLLEAQGIEVTPTAEPAS